MWKGEFGEEITTQVSLQPQYILDKIIIIKIAILKKNV